MVYLITFFITIFLFYFAEVLSKKNKRLAILMLLIASLPLGLLAGFRSERIGTDLIVYVRPIFLLSINVDSFSQLVQLKPDTEIGYLFLNFVISRFTNDFQLYLFIVEYIIILFFALGLFRFRTKGSLTFGMLLFCFLFYNRSLNIVRQFLAMSIIFLNLKYYFENKDLKFIISVMFASLFHTSAIIVLPIIYLAKLKNKVWQYLSYLTIFISVIFYSEIIQFLVIDLGILSSKYLFFVNNRTELGINYPEEFIRIIFLIFLFGYGYFNKKSEIENKSKLDMFMTFDFILLQIGTISIYASRITWFFFSIYLISLSRFFYQQTQVYRIIANILLFILLLLYWWWSFVYSNYGQTYPFEFFK
ncbi:EpsG family protein [Streptococcus suis]|uniref:EpsG family protein n=1 Tax=Streptococcus parasuis TaxID=1501662 RepID=UPI0015565687|nr:EpsG family protein [Streptococcus suis]WNF87124.1 EpsG family protein [Streptococcus parasuis]